ncbi:uncharacterized protein LOC143535814 [Bidens hawaiensis]|uniref:uncharacterized protein LOC143535814 n=1 Tax=Bidens hawaiensis TaxID=980011 RepID=UPI00404AE0C9
MLHDLETNIGDDHHEKLQHLFDDAEKPLYAGCDKISKLGAVLRNEFKNLHKCVTCGASRYKRKKESDEIHDDVRKNGPPAKMLWYFPIIPRLQRLFSNEKEAKLLRWHSEERINDGKLRHVTDSPQWKKIDNIYPEFGKEIRNIRFGLSSDGISPFGTMSSLRSMWPVLLCIYNLPPWLCMKRKYIMMSLLIEGPKQPGNDIDVYLLPLIDDLKTLWNLGVNVYDAYTEQYFNLRAMIFCTISDFPAYGNLSGYSTKGYKACPVCEKHTSSVRLRNCKKVVYMGHRRFLPEDHVYRKKKNEFNGCTEHETARKQFNAYDQVKNINTVWGKRTRDGNGAGAGAGTGVGIWKKKSIFWDLPYWKDLEVRHCLDVMHIEKNVCDSLLGLLLNIPGKTKDGIRVRRDMQEMGIRKELAPVEKGNRIFLPPASHTMSNAEKKMFCKCLHEIKVLSRYSANIKRLVSMKDLKLIGMKSHDCHVLMTHMIPIAIRGSLPENVRNTITKLCWFFNTIHSKSIDPDTLDALEKDVYITLC